MNRTPLTAQLLAERIREQLHTDGVTWEMSFADGFSMGDPEVQVRGVAATFKPTLGVLKQAAAKGLNVVISHEAAFWYGFDRLNVMPDDPTRRAKVEFVRANDMAVWRVHDHMHRRRPEPIFAGLLRKLDWTPYFSGRLDRLEIPATRLDELAEYLQDKLETRNVSVVGNPAMTVRSVGFGIHVLSTVLPALRASDVAIVGETAEYDTYEYMRDAVALGHDKGLIRIAHERLEEWGVADFPPWLRRLTDGLPVEWLSNGDPFTVADVI